MQTDNFRKKACSVESKIQVALELFSGANESCTEPHWTRRIKEIVAGLAKQEKNEEIFAAHSHKMFSDHGEWLFDITWWSESNEGSIYRLNNLPLVVECEWKDNISDIQYDFEKLVIARADHRLMIFQGASTDFIKQSIKHLNSVIYGYKHTLKGDRYMFAGVNYNNGEFIFDLTVVE
jgi:hypothetical protein